MNYKELRVEYPLDKLQLKLDRQGKNMSQDLKNNCSSNSSNEQPTPKKFSLENLANLSKILASVVSIVSDFWKMIFH